MRYLLTENKLNELNKYIYDFIDGMFDTDTIYYGHPENDYGGEDKYRCLFFKYSDSEDEDVFRWYDKEYWNDDTEKGLELKSESPIISVEEPFNSKLDNLFGELWKPVFLKWFNQNYPKYRAKTVNF